MGTKYIIEVEDKPFELLSEDGFTSEKLFRVKGFNSLVFDWNGLNMLTPYTEPDLEQVRKEANKIGYEKGYRDGVNRIGDAEDKIRKEAYEQGRKDVETQFCSYDACKNRQEEYQRGLADAWDAARKIVIGDINIIVSVFGTASRSIIIRDLAAAEVIEKLKAYEQEQDEKKKTDYYFKMMKDAIETSAKEYGMSLDEIAAVLEKMRNEPNAQIDT